VIKPTNVKKIAKNFIFNLREKFDLIFGDSRMTENPNSKFHEDFFEFRREQIIKTANKQCGVKNSKSYSRGSSKKPPRNFPGNR
jgi:hypothetical protein